MPLFRKFKLTFEHRGSTVQGHRKPGTWIVPSLHWSLVTPYLKWIFFVLCNVYTCFAISCSWNDPKSEASIQLLVAILLIADLYTFYEICAKRSLIYPLARKLKDVFRNTTQRSKAYEISQRLFVVAMFTTLGIFLVFDTEGNRSRLISFAGTFIVLLFGYVYSFNRKRIRWRPVWMGVLIQYIFGIIIFRWDPGREFVDTVQQKLVGFMNYTDFGSGYAYGYLATGNFGGKDNALYTMCYKTLPGIVFMSVWMSVLYHYGITQKVVLKLGWLLEHILGTTAPESIAAAANVALTMPEASLAIHSHLKHMTSSEIHAVMTAGFATIAGNMFGAYVLLGTSASHLVFASLMSAPAALAFSKLFYPETETCRNQEWMFILRKCECKNVVSAIVAGAASGFQLMLKVMSNLVGFISFISILNFLPGWYGELVGLPFISLKWFFGKLLFPVAYLIGIDVMDAFNVAYLIGINACFTNMAAYKIMSDMRNGCNISIRSEIVATYAICGFCNLSSVGVATTSLDTLEPDRKPEVSALLIRTFVAGTCACLMTACVAGSMILD